MKKITLGTVIKGTFTLGIISDILAIFIPTYAVMFGCLGVVLLGLTAFMLLFYLESDC